MAAKAIGVWWGIFIILGCCIGFFFNIMFGFFNANGMNMELSAFFPLMLSGSLVLAVFAFMLNCLIRRAPERRTRRRLDAVIREKGVCKDYTDILFTNARADMKNYYCIEIALCYCVMGDTKQAKALLDRIDVVSVLDIAQSTGNYCSAAYYYAGVILCAMQMGDMTAAEEAYESGRFYIEALSNDKYMLCVQALYCALKGKTGLAADFVREVKTKNIHKKAHVLRNSLIALIKSHILCKGGYRADAQDAVLEAMKFNITSHYAGIAAELSKKIHDVKPVSDALAKADCVKTEIERQEV